VSTKAARIWKCDLCGAEAVVSGSGSTDTPPVNRTPRGWWYGGPRVGRIGRVALCPAHAETGIRYSELWGRWRDARRELATECYAKANAAHREMTAPLTEWDASHPEPTLDYILTPEVP
jgi:hypothetical protein